MFQSVRNARLVAAIATVYKLIAGYLSDTDCTVACRENVLIRSFCQCLMETYPVRFVPKIKAVVKAAESVDIDALPENAKRIRKRPASA